MLDEFIRSLTDAGLELVRDEQITVDALCAPFEMGFGGRMCNEPALLPFADKV